MAAVVLVPPCPVPLARSPVLQPHRSARLFRPRGEHFQLDPALPPERRREHIGHAAAHPVLNSLQVRGVTTPAVEPVPEALLGEPHDITCRRASASRSTRRRAFARRMLATPGLGASRRIAASMPSWWQSTTRESSVRLTRSSSSTRSGVRLARRGVAVATGGVTTRSAGTGWGVHTGAGFEALGKAPVPTTVTRPATIWVPSGNDQRVPLARAYSPFAHQGT